MLRGQECRVAMSRVSWNKFYQLTRPNPPNPGSSTWWPWPEAWSLTSTGEAEYRGDVL